MYLYLLYLQEVELWDKQRADRKQQIVWLHMSTSNRRISCLLFTENKIQLVENKVPSIKNENYGFVLQERTIS